MKERVQSYSAQCRFGLLSKQLKLRCRHSNADLPHKGLYRNYCLHFRLLGKYAQPTVYVLPRNNKTPQKGHPESRFRVSSWQGFTKVLIPKIIEKLCSPLAGEPKSLISKGRKIKIKQDFRYLIPCFILIMKEILNQVQNDFWVGLPSGSSF